MTFRQSPAQVKRLIRNRDRAAGKQVTMDAHKEEFTMSELMMEYIRIVERAMGRRLKPDEVRLVTPEARQYAVNMRKWMAKRPAAHSPQEKEATK
jgi:hypothetical protein